MSKFDEICNSYKISRENFFSFKHESYEFAKLMIGEYLKYLEIPKELFKYVPLNKKPKDTDNYNIIGATNLEDDGYWSLGLQVTVYSAPNEYPRQPILMKFKFRKTSDDKYLVKIYEEDEGHIVNIKQESCFNDFFGFLQTKIKSNFENEIQDYLEQSAPLKTIGFIQK